MSLVTIAAYQFFKLDHLPELREKIKEACFSLGFTGTVLLSHEGINYFICGEKSKTDQFKEYLERELRLTHLCYKEHPCLKSPFVRLLVKIKKEIISMGDPSIIPEESTAPYISPLQLKEWLDTQKDITLIDTRNTYEIACGTFENAIDLQLDSFRQITEAYKKLPDSVKEKPVVMFCTGGIRCEKASAYFMKNGFKEVYQLQGGILNYFEQCGDAHYSGNCFVFDWRLAVDSQFQSQTRDQVEPIHAGRHQLKDQNSNQS